MQTKIETTKNDKGYWIDGNGNAIPPRLITKVDKDREKVIKKSGNKMLKLSEQIAKAKREVEEIVDHYFGDMDLPDNWKGNMEIISYDGKAKLYIKTNAVTDFTEQIHAAKAQLDDLLEEWTASSRDEIKYLVQKAFVTNRKGQMDKRAILGLRSLEIKDKRWQSIMDLIGKSLKTVTRKRYIMLLLQGKDGWETVNLDWARAK